MTTRFTCSDTDTLVGYLYDEVDAVTHAAVTRHLAECARCRDEVTALGGVRQVLAQWTPPAPPLRFTLSDTAVPPAEAPTDNVLRPRVSAWQAVPVWAQVAAATLALAVSASIANVQVRHDASGWTVSTGWMTPAAAPATATAARADEAWRPVVARLEQSLRELDSRRAAAPTPVSAPVASGASDSQLLAQMKVLIEASEHRQQQELALRLTQFNRDLDLQRRADLVRIDQGLGQLEGRTGAEVQRQRQMLDYIVRAGIKVPQ